MIRFPNCSQDQKPVSYNLVSQPATFPTIPGYGRRFTRNADNWKDLS